MSLRLPIATLIALSMCSLAPAFAQSRPQGSATLLDQALAEPSPMRLSAESLDSTSGAPRGWSLKTHSPTAQPDEDASYSWAISYGPNTFTFLSAEGMRRPSALGKPSVPGKMIADWRSLFSGGQLSRDSQQAWMGGILSRDGDGGLYFEALLEGDSFAGSIDRFKNDVWEFLIAAGPATTRLFATTYGVEPTRSEGMQQYNATNWDLAMASTLAPGATKVVGGLYGGTSATIVYGASGSPIHVLDNLGLPAEFSEFIVRPEFTALTGRGIAAQ